MEKVPGKVDRAIQIAVEAHMGQTDRSGQPYILHPMRVGAMGVTQETQIVGFLHDVLEDTDVTAQSILDEFGSAITEALLSVTKKDNEPYDEFIRRASHNKIGRLVKLNDLYDNTRDERVCLLHKTVKARLIPKYDTAIKYLEEHL